MCCVVVAVTTWSSGVRSGSENVPSVASVSGSSMYSSGPDALMQIDTTRPWLSNAIDPQSRPGARYDESVWGERPSGPDHA
jgi:hypothetical protein